MIDQERMIGRIEGLNMAHAAIQKISRAKHQSDFANEIAKQKRKIQLTMESENENRNKK